MSFFKFKNLVVGNNKPNLLSVLIEIFKNLKTKNTPTDRCSIKYFLTSNEKIYKAVHFLSKIAGRNA